jgi:hypothetical protein
MGSVIPAKAGIYEDAQERSNSALFREMFSERKFAMLRVAGTSEAGHLL